MGWGKLRRAFLVKFRKGRVEEKLQRRKGACTRCGACCKILFNCPAYDDSDGSPKCLIYNDRPGVCGLFPLDEKDLRDRDIGSPDRKCGFYFEDPAVPGNGSGNGNGKEKAHRPESMPLRWGPSKIDEKGKRKLFTGVWSIIAAYFHKPNGNGNGKHHA